MNSLVINRRYRLLAFIFAIASVLAAGYFFKEWKFIGFPGGYATSFQRQMIAPYLIGGVSCLGFSVYFSCLLFEAPMTCHRKLLVSMILFALLLTTIKLALTLGFE